MSKKLKHNKSYRSHLRQQTQLLAHIWSQVEGEVRLYLLCFLFIHEWCSQKYHCIIYDSEAILKCMRSSSPSSFSNKTNKNLSHKNRNIFTLWKLFWEKYIFYAKIIFMLRSFAIFISFNRIFLFSLTTIFLFFFIYF